MYEEPTIAVEFKVEPSVESSFLYISCVHHQNMNIDTLEQMLQLIDKEDILQIPHLYTHIAVPTLVSTQVNHSLLWSKLLHSPL